MSRYLLDATICSHLMGNDPTVFARLDALTNVDYYFTIPIVYGEIQYGIERLETGRKRRELSQRADYLFHEVPCEAIPREAGNYYAQLKRQSERQGTPLEDNDLWIASTALVFDAILVTSDSDFVAYRDYLDCIWKIGRCNFSMPHDIIDNRNEKLVEHINLILDSTERARFAVGYFFLSGFQSIAEKLTGIKELCLLIGNTTNRQTQA